MNMLWEDTTRNALGDREILGTLRHRWRAILRTRFEAQIDRDTRNVPKHKWTDIKRETCSETETKSDIEAHLERDWGRY